MVEMRCGVANGARAAELTGAAPLGPGMDHVAHLSAWATTGARWRLGSWNLPFTIRPSNEGSKPPLLQICETVDADLGYTDDGRRPALELSVPIPAIQDRSVAGWET